MKVDLNNDLLTPGETGELLTSQLSLLKDQSFVHVELWTSDCEVQDHASLETVDCRSLPVTCGQWLNELLTGRMIIH